MPREGTGIRILHVDDDSSFLALTKAFLELGYEEFSVDTTASAEDGLERLKSCSYDVVLSDYQMPTMDGLEATRLIRSDASLADIPIIALTALVTPGDRERCLEAGANGFLSKPVSLKGLFEAIEAQLQR